MFRGESKSKQEEYQFWEILCQPSPSSPSNLIQSPSHVQSPIPSSPASMPVLEEPPKVNLEINPNSVLVSPTRSPHTTLSFVSSQNIPPSPSLTETESYTQPV